MYELRNTPSFKRHISSFTLIHNFKGGEKYSKRTLHLLQNAITGTMKHKAKVFIWSKQNYLLFSWLPGMAS